MKKLKKTIAIAVALIISTAAFTSCSFSFGGNGDQQANEAEQETTLGQATYANDAGDSDDNDKKGVFTGTGNSTDAFKLYLFDKEYQVGKSTVSDLTSNGWGRDPESWKEVDVKEKLEYKTKTVSYVELDKKSTEITISYKNLTKPFATYQDCTITSLEFKGAPEATFKKANFTAFGKKLKISDCDTIDAFENALEPIIDSATKEVSDYTYSKYVTYTVEIDGNKVEFYLQEDKEKGTLEEVKVTYSMGYDYTIKDD